MNHSKSILDQVDEYLHDNDTHSGNHMVYMESEKEPMSNVQLYSHNWLTDDIQLDLDHIGESFFNNGNNNQNSNNSRLNAHEQHSSSHSNNSVESMHGTIESQHEHHAQQHPDIGKSIDPEMNGGFGLMDHSIKQNDATASLLNKNSHFSNIHSDLVFSPSASPLVAPGQSAIGLKVTPYMNPQVLIGSNSSNVSNMNTPYLRESIGTNNGTNNNGTLLNNGSTTTTPHVSHYSPLSSPAVNDHNQQYSSTNFTLPASAVEEPITNGGSGSKTTRSKRTSSSSRSKRISFSSSSGNSTKQTFNGSSSKVRKNSPYLSANRSRRNYQELKTKNGSTISNNNDSASSTPMGNNSTTPTNASWDDMVFKLPESSTTVISTSNGTNIDTPDSGSKESSLTASQFAVASKILPASYPDQVSSNDIDIDGSIIQKRIEIPLQTSIETTESWKQKTNSDRSRSSNSLSSNGTSPKNGKNGINNVGVSPLIKSKKPSKTNGDSGSTIRLTRTDSRSSESKSGKKDDTKKEVHKVAEQERRNRLNSALNDLCGLIPDDLKEMISIPSKATTAELACVYIRSLQKRVHELEQEHNH